ncbi:hypothetical protein Tco_0176787 [Tanacetum coccineum]
MQGILKKKMNLLKTALNSQYGIPIPQQTYLLQKQIIREEVQGRKNAKGESSVQRNPMFDVMPEDNIDHMETDNAQSEGRTKEMVDEDKEIDEDRVSTEDGVSTVKVGVSTDFEKVSTDFEKVSTDKPKVSTDGSKVSVDDQVEGTEEIFESTKSKDQVLKKKLKVLLGK